MGLLLQQAAQIARKERSSVEVVTAAIEAAEKLQPTLNAFTGIYGDEALAAAREADGAPDEDRGPLHGVPVAVKDLYDVSGHVSSGCSRAYLDAQPAAEDSPHVAALRRDGAIVIGKTNMHELAFGGTTSVSCYGPANNPWDPARMTGGSSGGSGGAVGARIVGAALASDTGGSIRMPSSFCGATGLKTTWARLPLHGMMPMSPSLDTAGVIATDVADARAIFASLERRLPSAKTAGRYRIGIARDPFLDAVDPEVAAALDRAASDLTGVGEIRDVPVPWIEATHNAWLYVALAEFAREYRALVERQEDLDPSIAVILNAGLAVTAEDERASWDAFAAARAAFAETMGDLDALLLAATPHPAPRHEDQMVAVTGTELPVHLGGVARFAEPINVIAAPAVVMPSGFSSSGLPLGIQLVGRRGSEELLLDLGEAYQRATDWHSRLPALHA
ncbi:MAG: amidase [Actinomycetota bacterium]